MDVFELRQRLVSDHASYVGGFSEIRDKRIRTHVEESLLMPQHPNYIDPLRWDPLIMKFTEYFAGGTIARPSSLARGWDMPALETVEAGA